MKREIFEVQYEWIFVYISIMYYVLPIGLDKLNVRIIFGMLYFII